MQPGRNLAVEFITAGFAALWLPLGWIVSVPAALLRRVRRSADESAQASLLAGVDRRGWTLELLKRIEWRRFEALCGAYFELAPAGAARPLVHCKAWDAGSIGIRPLRALRAAMSAAPAAAGVFVTSGKFTREALDFAAQEKIELVDGPGLLAKIQALAPDAAAALLASATAGDFLTPTCPACDVKMESRRSTHQGRKFWGCANYPRCKQTFFTTHNGPG